MTTTRPASGAHFCRRSWAKVKRAAIGFVVAGFVIALFLAISAQAQTPAAPKNKAAEKKKDKAKSTVVEPALVVPGAGKKLDAQALARIIDQEVQRQLAMEKISPSPLADDAEFLRRVYLDLVGVIPPSEKVATFLKSTEPDKRAKVIDELLADTRFGTHLAEIWAGLMVPVDSGNKKLDGSQLNKWLAADFNQNKPLNQLVYDLITATGEQTENGAVTYFMANPSVDKVTDNVSRMFLGVQLQCAQCHNHPFTDYKQNEYWGMAAFFMKVKDSPKGVSEIALAPAKAGKKNKAIPESAKFVPAKFLQGEEPKVKADEPFRPVLAKWLTSSDNPFFARAMVNRFWYQLFGRGLVNPVDDMHQDNQPTHPELLAALTEQLKTSDFDLKYLVRAVCNSETYQRTSKPANDNAGDTANYSHRLVRVMSAEQLYDSIVAVVGKTEKIRDSGAGKKKGPNVTGRDNFVGFFRIGDGVDPLQYQIGIPQALRLMNSAQLNASSDAVTHAMTGAKGAPEVIDNLFLQILSRPATPPEVERYSSYVAKASNLRTGYSDVAWVLLNSSEFATNH